MRIESPVVPTIAASAPAAYPGAPPCKHGKLWGWTAVCRTCVPYRVLAERKRYLEVGQCVDAHLAEPGHGEHEIDMFPEL